MTVRPDLEKRIAELADGDTWQLADLLVDEFPPGEYGEGGSKVNTGLYEELRQYELALARDYGILLSAKTLRDYRSTALAWPHVARETRASFDVHNRIRGENRYTEMRLRLRQANREGQALSARMLSRFRYDENPRPVKLFEERMRRAVTNAVRRELLGGIITKRDDWWMATNVTDEARAVAVRELRALASAINKGAINDADV